MVTVSFRLYDAGGDLLDEVKPDDPLAYVHGYAQIVVGLESGLLGAEEGEERSIVVPPEEAFGAHDPEALLEIDPADFPEADRAAIGGEIVATGPDGVEAVHRIVHVDDDAIVVDLNHPLAGETIRFEVRVCGVRAATEPELDMAKADVDERIARCGLRAASREASTRSGGAAPATADDASVQGKRHLTIAHDTLLVYGSQSGDSGTASREEAPEPVQAFGGPLTATEDNDE